jgi:hypothetical protein
MLFARNPFSGSRFRLFRGIPVLLLALVLFSCHEPSEPDPPRLVYGSGLVLEHCSYRNRDGDGWHETRYRDSSFAAALGPISAFNRDARQDVADYLLSHLKQVSTLRPIGMTHVFRPADARSLYYVVYARNGKAESRYRCVLSRKEGRYRLYRQNLNPERDKAFRAVFTELSDSAALQALQGGKNP